MQQSQKFSSAAKRASEESEYKAEIITCPGGLNRWHLVNDYLKLRKEVFVDRLEWPLFHAEELEFEQYDTFDTVYVVATRGGEVVGGARLRRTDQETGNGQLTYSYMIRDASLGILPGLPQNLCDELPPMQKDVWEITRMVVKGPKEVFALILDTSNTYLRTKGASTVLFLGSPAFQRMADTWAWPVKTLGPVVGNADGRFQVFECPVRHL
ncbi:MAG: acyl-homoserine-lactone synthase [Paracoccus sp. (in: a-proteobacteria)]|uniref:acyl-homoserine-lactone synthase n=1 Tax=Paracoccus sp. TaxID=267 RepID=UPI00391C1DE7